MRDIKKQLLGAIGVLAVVGSSMFAMLPARAQLVVSEPVVSANTTKEQVVDKTIGDIMLEGAVVSVVSGLNYMAQQIAYSLAVSLTSECPGQKVCWDSKAISEALTQSWQGAIGESIGTLNEELGLGKYGLDLCNPDPRFLLQLQLGLLDELKPPEPKCNFNDIIDSYESLGEEIGSGEFLDRFKATLTPGQAPVSVSLNILNGLYAERQQEEKLSIVKRINDASAGGGFTDLRDPVSGRVTAPAEVVRDRFAEGARSKEKGAEGVNQIIAGQIASRAFTTIAINAAQTFAQTLIARLWNRFAEGLLSTEELVASQPDLVLNAEGLLNPGRAGISNAIAPRFTNNAATPRETGVIDTLLILSTCPTQGRQPMNCAMDAQLAQAARLADSDPVTVREALEKNLLHGDWPLISSKDTARNQDPFCYTYGYCDSSLKKLRAARIIPVGWELAANLSTVERPYKLKDVVDGFDDCRKQCSGGVNSGDVCRQDSDCPSSLCVSINERDAEHPFCHLIDPDWVLKAPPTQCRAEVNGPVPLSPDVAARASICVDPRTCLAQDDAGNCIGGYGHCTEDKRVWRFNGQQCPAQFASCALFTGPDGNPTGLLTNTIDQGVCNAANAGCEKYSLNRTVTTQGVGGNPASKSDDWVTNYSYFNGTLRKCDASNDGCQALIPLAGSTLNLIRNGGFEEVEGVSGSPSDSHPTFWAPYSQPAVDQAIYLSRDGSKSSSGTNAVLLAGDTESIMQDDITVPGGNTYTLSATLVPVTGSKVDARFVLYFRDKNGSWIDLDAADFAFTTGHTGFSGTPTFPIVTTSSTAPDGTSNGLRMTFSGNVTGSRGRIWVTFATPNKNVQTLRFAVRQAGSGWSPTYLDDVQLELGGSPTAFHEGYGAQPRAVHAKVAPGYLGCTGAPTDRVECNKYAPLCSANEVGCESYTPTNGDAVVPGVVTAQDRCPAECAGYDTFKQEASTFDAEKFPEYFIPETAQSCSAADVGCSQFTDIENEQVSYYSSLRSCVGLDDASVGTFYSWEGSDTTGYQLKLWTLKNSTEVATMDGVNDVCAEITGCTDTVAPCTQINGQNGACVSATRTQNTTQRLGFCSRSDIDAGNFDCREFYDTTGNKHYRLLSRTIVASASCRQYRITTSTSSDCSASNGRWDANAARCTYFADLGLSSSCSAAANGCRAYKGNASTNIRTIFQEDFENGTLDTTQWSGAHRISSEAIVVGGHSVQVSSATLRLKVQSLMRPGRAYSISFWARGTGQLDIPIEKGSTAPANAQVTLNPTAPWSVSLVSEWRKFDLGPTFVVPPTAGPDWGSYDVMLSFAKASGEAYIDNIVLREVQDTISVVRNSWKTPVSCDQTAAGVASPQEMLGCREYKSRLGGTEFLRSFSRICREKAIGCAAYSTTAYTTADPYASTKLAVCRAAAGTACDYRMPDGGVLQDVCTVPAGATECRFSLPGRLDNTSGTYLDRVRLAGDSAVYLAVRAQDRCPATQESCRVMGTPVESHPATGSAVITEWKEGAYIYDAAKFDSLLCRVEEVSCKAFKSDNGGAAYFKDPTGKLCDYRENVGPVTVGTTTNAADNAKYSGWFVTGLEGNVVCPGARLSNGSVYAIARNDDDSRYASWAGSCDAQFNKCEEFVDPLDVSGLGSAAVAGGRAYYYINDQRVNGAECNGQASVEQGCVLFDRTNDPRKLYAAKATYDASKAKNGALVPPTASGTLNTNVILKVRPDRECAEWLACDSRQATWDKNQGKWRNVCTNLTLCNQSKISGSGEECTNSVDPDGRLLTADVYAKGVRSFSTTEPSGFSVPNRYPLSLTQSANYGTGCGSGVTCSDDSPRTMTRYGAVLDVGDRCEDNGDCGQTCNGGTNAGRLCSSDSQCAGRKEDGSSATCNAGTGACVTGKCFYALDGGTLSKSFDPSTSPSCRAYPEGDSPFPGSVVDTWNDQNGAADGIKQAYRGANTCADKNDCECSYQRYSYVGGATKFFSAASPDTRFGSGDFSKGICSGGPNQGEPCTPSGNHCDREKNGICQPIEKRSIAVGWWGFCADPDTGFNINGTLREFACNLWLPVDQLAGVPDLYNQYREAGFLHDEQLLYCQVGRGTQRNNTYSVVLDDVRNSGADKYLRHPGGDEIEVNVVNFDETEYAQNGGASIHEYEIAEIYVDGRISFPLFRSEGNGYWEFYRNWNEESSSSPPDGTFYELTTSSDANRCHNDDHMARTESANYADVGDGNACYGLRIYFDKTDGTGKIQRIVAGIMSDNEESNPGLGIRITVKLRDMCNEIAYAYDPTSSDNVPWTDRLWKSTYSGIDRLHTSSRISGEEIDMAPFGRVGTVPTSVVSRSTGNLAFPAATAGVPSIYEKWLPIYSSEEGSGFTWSAVNAAKDGIDRQLGVTVSGIPYACEGDCGNLPESRNKQGASASLTGRNLLGGLFAKVWRVWRWNLAEERYDGLTGSSEEWDLRESSAPSNSAPQIVGVETATCFAEHGDRACEEASSGVTVNGRNSGDVFSSGERYNVEIRFYGFADANHMPIRNVRIDYGDRSGEGGGPGFYRNHRGLTVDAGGDKGTPICKGSGAANWGVKSPEACQTGDFSFQKLYLCSTLPSAQCNGNNYPCTRDGACVFQPKVQITDNWGVCNGICPGAPGQGNLCMGDECSDKAGAWTAYDGEIILKPNPR